MLTASTESISTNDNCCSPGRHDRVHSSLEVQEAIRRIQCPYGFPSGVNDGECSAACAPLLTFWWSQCHAVYNGTQLGGRMQTAADSCRAVLIRDGALAVYQKIGEEVYVPVALWILSALPLMFFAIFVFMGRQLETTFCMVVGFCAFFFPLGIPATQPYLDTCGMQFDTTGASPDCSASPPLQVETVVQVFLAVVCGLIAAQSCRDNKTFGRVVRHDNLLFMILIAAPSSFA